MERDLFFDEMVIGNQNTLDVFESVLDCAINPVMRADGEKVNSIAIFESLSEAPGNTFRIPPRTKS